MGVNIDAQRNDDTAYTIALQRSVIFHFLYLIIGIIEILSIFKKYFSERPRYLSLELIILGFSGIGFFTKPNLAKNLNLLLIR